MKTIYKPAVLFMLTIICITQVNSSALTFMRELQYYEDFEIEIIKDGPNHFRLISVSKDEICNWESIEASIEEGHKAYVDNSGLRTGFFNFSQILNVDTHQSEFEFEIKNRGHNDIQIVGKKGTSWSKLKATIAVGEKVTIDPDGFKTN